MLSEKGRPNPGAHTYNNKVAKFAPQNYSLNYAIDRYKKSVLNYTGFYEQKHIDFLTNDENIKASLVWVPIYIGYAKISYYDYRYNYDETTTKTTMNWTVGNTKTTTTTTYTNNVRRNYNNSFSYRVDPYDMFSSFKNVNYYPINENFKDGLVIQNQNYSIQAKNDVISYGNACVSEDFKAIYTKYQGYNYKITGGDLHYTGGITIFYPVLEVAYKDPLSTHIWECCYYNGATGDTICGLKINNNLATAENKKQKEEYLKYANKKCKKHAIPRYIVLLLLPILVIGLVFLGFMMYYMFAENTSLNTGIWGLLILILDGAIGLLIAGGNIYLSIGQGMLSDIYYDCISRPYSKIYDAKTNQLDIKEIDNIIYEALKSNFTYKYFFIALGVSLLYVALNGVPCLILYLIYK